MKVSIIIPVFNTEEFPKERLRILINQTLQDIEIVLAVDENASDSLLDICRKYEGDYPEKIKLHMGSNRLPDDLRSYGLEAGADEYIGVVDPNDPSGLKEEGGKVILPGDVKLNMSWGSYMIIQLSQKYVMEVLLAVDRFCHDNNITYYLGEGTLLGAVCHGGFIPWDDSVDILMPRADYERFLRLAIDGLPDGYVLDCMGTNPRYWTVSAKVEMTRKVPYSQKELEGIALYNGPCIDIFPLDFVPSDRPEDLKERGKRVDILRRIMWIKSGFHDRKRYETLGRRLKYYYPLKIYGAFRRSLRSVFDQIQRIMTETNDPSLECVCVFGSLYPASQESFPKEYFGTPQYIEFEGHMLPVPSEPDKILKRIYGDYMQLPPVKDRKGKHSFILDEKAMKDFEDDELFLQVFKRLKEEAARPKPAKKKKGRLAKIKNRLKRIVKKIWETGKRCVRYIVKMPWRIARKIRDLARRKLRGGWIAQYYKLPVLEKTILYDALYGLGVLDSPRALFKRLLEREEFRDFTHIWIISDPKALKPNMEEFSKLDNVVFVKRHSKQHVRYLTTAKYLICSNALPQYFARRPEQIYLNTWHGVATKVMGYERPGQRVSSTKNVVQTFLNTTHLVSANHFCGERMFKQAYLLEGLYEGRLLDEPMPRSDAIHNTDRGYVLDKLKSAGIIADKKIIVYAPTWRGKTAQTLKYNIKELKSAVRILRENIDTDEYDVFLRVHYFLYRAISMDEEMKKICIPFTIDTNELLSVVDILISDYSSIFFDFLSTRRPILFYVPDIEDYSENRGLYVPIEELPGPVSTTIEGIAYRINHIERVKEDYADKYDAMYEWCCAKEDGRATDRIIDAVFLNKEIPVMNCRNNKKKLLFMAEFSRSFVSQSTLTELFQKIDYSKYDVTLLTGNPGSKYRKQMLETLDPHVRILINNKAINCGAGVRKGVYKALEKGTINLDNAVRKLGCSYEWQRLVGDSKFDQLCVLQPTMSVPNWLILSYIAPIDHKVFIQSETAFRSASVRKDMLDHFNAVYDELDYYSETL